MIVYSGFEVPFERMPGRGGDESKLELNSMFPPKAGSIKEGVERIIKLALKLVNFLVTAYMKSFPSISEELKMIKMKLEELFEKVSSSYY